MRQLLHCVLQADVPTINNVNAVRLRIGDMFVHEAPKTGKVSSNGRNSHDRALRWRITPGFIVRWENAQMAAADKLFVIQAEQRIRRAQKLRMEDDLYAVIDRVEHVAATNSAQHRVIPVVHNIMRRHWRQSITLQTIKTAFDLDHVVFR